MKEQDIDNINKKLIEMKEKMEKNIESIKINDNINKSERNDGELSNYDNHPADIASYLYQIEHSKGLKDHQERILDKINTAIGKIMTGEFGLCKECGKKIPDDRLEALPYAEMCLTCEKDWIKNKSLEVSPVEDKIINILPEQDELMKYGSADSPQDIGGYGDTSDFYSRKKENDDLVDKMDKYSDSYYRKQLQ